MYPRKVGIVVLVKKKQPLWSGTCLIQQMFILSQRMKTPKLRIQFFTVVLLSLIVLSCEDDRIPLNKNKHQVFEGSFTLKTDNKSTNQSGSSTLEILNGKFDGYTYDGGVHAAGKFTVTENKITFIDTVFKIYPTNIIPPRSLNGTYDYAFDGNKLQIGNKYASGWIEEHTFYLENQ